MLVVKKFGGTSVADKERIINVAKRCIADYKAGNDVVVVLSAMGKQTDVLIDMAKDINPNPPRRELDMLMTTGEQVSVAMMAMAMDSLGVPSVSLNAYQVAMHTTSVYGNARLKRIDTERIRNELDLKKIVIITGFQGVNKYDDYTTLGRGGSDTTAVALAAALHADKCEIYTYMAGDGCTLPGCATVLMPGEGYEGVTKFVMDRMTSYGLNACPPLLVGVGVATSVETAALLSKKALMRPIGSHNENERAAKMEKLLEDGINAIGLGPQGMGGKYSVMGVNIENTARHPSAIGVAVNVGCWSHRRGHIIFDADLNYEITTHTGVEL